MRSVSIRMATWHVLGILTWRASGTRSPKPVIIRAGLVVVSRALHAAFVIHYGYLFGGTPDA